MTPEQEIRLLITLDKLSALPDKVHELELKLAGEIQRVTSVERRIEKVEESSENSGSIYLDDVKGKLKTYESSQAHWVRYVIGAAVTILMMGFSVYLGYALRK